MGSDLGWMLSWHYCFCFEVSIAPAGQRLSRMVGTGFVGCAPEPSQTHAISGDGTRAWWPERDADLVEGGASSCSPALWRVGDAVRAALFIHFA